MKIVDEGACGEAGVLKRISVLLVLRIGDSIRERHVTTETPSAGTGVRREKRESRHYGDERRETRRSWM